MNPIHIALIGTRLVAIYLVAQGITSVYSAYMIASGFNAFDGTLPNAYIITAVMSPGIIGVMLWFLAPALAKHFIPSQVTDASANQSNYKQLQSFAIALVGVAVVLGLTDDIVEFFRNLSDGTSETAKTKITIFRVLSSKIIELINRIFTLLNLQLNYC